MKPQVLRGSHLSRNTVTISERQKSLSYPLALAQPIVADNSAAIVSKSAEREVLSSAGTTVQQTKSNAFTSHQPDNSTTGKPTLYLKQETAAYVASDFSPFCVSK